MLWLVVFILASFLAMVILSLARLLSVKFSLFQGPVYVPSTDEDTVAMLELAQLKQGKRVIDLGSGNGKIVIAAALRGALATGVENNPLLVRSARKKLEQAGITQQAEIKQQSFWDADLSQYEVVFLYGTRSIMKKMEQKLQREMKPGSVFISSVFQLPNLKPDKVVKGKIRRYRF